MASFLEVKSLCEEALSKKEFPMTLALKIQKLSKTVSTDGVVAVEAVRKGCVQLALTLMGQSTGTVRISATKLLVALVSRSEGLDVVESNRAELIALLYDDLYSDRLDVLVYALNLLAILVSYFEDSFQLVDKVAREMAVKKNEEAFKPLVDCLNNNSTDAQNAGASILCVLTERSLTLGCNESFVALLRCQNIEKVIHALKAKTQQGELLATTTTNTTFVLTQSGVAGQLRMHLDSLSMLCAEGSEWSKSVALTRQQAQLCAAEATRLSSPKLAARVAALTGIAKLAGVEADEKALVSALTEHLHAMEAKLEAMNEQQQREASVAIERQQLAMDAQLQAQRQVFEEKLAALTRESELGAASKAQAVLQLEIQALKDNQNLLLQEHAKNQHNVAEQAYLRQHKQLWLFYQCIQLKLNEVLLGYKVLASNLTSEAAVVTLAGQPVQLPATSGRSNSASGIAVSVRNMEQISEQCARTLCFRYESQLRQLEEKGARLLGECGVRRMMECLGCAVNHADDCGDFHAIIHSLVSSVASAEPPRPQEIATLVPKPKKLRWHESTIFSKPGVKTLDGDYYSSTACDVLQYGYRLGTAEEAKILGYSLDDFDKAALIDSGVLCFHVSPKLKTVLASRGRTEGSVTMASSLPIFSPSPRIPQPPQRREVSMDDDRDRQIAELQAELAAMKLRMAKMEGLVMSLVAQKTA